MNEDLWTQLGGGLFYPVLALVIWQITKAMKKRQHLEKAYDEMTQSDLEDLVNLGDKTARDELRNRIIRKQKK